MYQRGELQQLIKETAAEVQNRRAGRRVSCCANKSDLLRFAFFYSSLSPVGSGQPPSRFQRLTISQNSSAVRSVSYRAECACVPSNSIPAVIQAFDNTVCPSARPLSAAVSKVTNGWKGLRLSEARSAAAW